MRALFFTAGLIASLSTGSAAKAAEEVVGEPVAAPIAITPEITPEITSEIIEAHHAYQLALLRWQQYRFVELPRQRQMLDGQSRLLDSEISILKRRQRDYRPSLRAGRHSPLLTDAENNRLVLQVTEQRLKLLKNEQINLMRYSRQNAQLYQLDVLRAAARVRQLVAKVRQGQQ